MPLLQLILSNQTSTSPYIYFLMIIIRAKRASSSPVHNTERVVEQSEDDKFSVEQFVDTALPSQEQVEEGPQTCVSNSAGVCHCHCHRCCLLTNLLAGCGLT